MGLREILVIIGILVITVIIWDASKHMRRNKSGKDLVKNFVSPVNTPVIHTEIKADTTPLLAKRPNSDYLENENNTCKQSVESQNVSMHSDIHPDNTVENIPPLVDPVPTNSQKSHLMTTIGKKIQIEGTIKGDEELLIEGVVKGNITLENSTIIIGIYGQVDGDIYTNSADVKGLVHGNIVTVERTALRKGARIQGNIISPSLCIEDGACFQGSSIMEPGPKTNLQ